MAESKKEELFKIKESISNLFSFYRTPNIFATKKHPPMITTINSVPFILIPTDHSFYIYKLEDLTLQFMGPQFECIDAILINTYNVFVIQNNILYETSRGEITRKFNISSDSPVNKALKFGDFIVLASKCEFIVLKYNNVADDNLEFCSDIEEPLAEELYREQTDSEIVHIFHPHTYTNKILICFDDGRAQLFNLSSRKIIYSYSFPNKITAISQTSVLNVVGLGFEDGSSGIFNLKKDKLIFNISLNSPTKILYLSFKDKFALIQDENKMSIFDMEIKKEIYSKKNTYFGIMLNENMFITVSQDSMEIITMDDFNVLKRRMTMTDEINKLARLSDVELALVGKERIFKMNIYKDEQNDYIKTTHSIELFATDENILVYGDRKLSVVKEGKNTFLLAKKCTVVKHFKDYSLFCNSRYMHICNDKSGRFVLDYVSECEIIDCDFDNDKIAILTFNKITIIDYSKTVLKVHDLDSGNYTGIKIDGKFLYLKSKDKVTVYSDKAIRSFMADTYDLDPSRKLLCAIYNGDFILYDLLSGNILEHIKTSVPLKDAISMDRLFFVAVLDVENKVHILSNLSYFKRINNKYISARSTVKQVQLKHSETTFCQDLLLYKEGFGGKDQDLIIKGLNKTEVAEMLKIITRNFDKDYLSIKGILHKLLLYKGKMIDKNDLSEIKAKIDEKWQEYENNVIKTIGLLNLSKNKLL